MPKKTTAPRRLAPKKATAKKPEPRKAKGPDLSKLGADLEAALRKVPASWRPKTLDGVQATVAWLAKGQTPTNAALVKLRDAVNETSAAAREHDAKPLAKELSGLNRLVRRLERSTR